MSETITLKPASSGTGTGAAVNRENAYDGDTTTYANIYDTLTKTSPSMATSYEAFAYRYYNMDFSQIPSGVEIIGATLYAKASGDMSGSTNYNADALISTFLVSVYDGTLSISGISFSNTTEQKSVILTAEEATAWVNSSSPRVRCYARCTGKIAKRNNPCIREAHIYVYDIYAIIEYELPSGLQCKVKVNGNWEEAEVLVKVNGEWVNPSDAFVKVNGVWEPIR